MGRVDKDKTDVNVNLAELREHLRIDHRAFLLLYLHAFNLSAEDIKDFQVEMFTQLVTSADWEEFIAKIAIAWPRDFSKTTIIKAAIVYMMIYTPHRYFMYLTKTGAGAVAACADIIDTIVGPGGELTVFGEIFGPPERFLIKNRTTADYEFKWGDKLIILQGRSVNKTVRGSNRMNLRPEVLVFDDIEAKEDGEDTKGGYAGTSAWFWDTAVPSAASKGTLIAYIANQVDNPSILIDLMEDDSWRHIRLSAILPDGTALWPEKHPVPKLAQDYMKAVARGRGAQWLGERMNIVVKDGDSWLKLDKVSLVPDVDPDDPDIVLRCITVDPAISKSKRADRAVIAVHGYYSGTWRLLEIQSFDGPNVVEFADSIIDLAIKWGVTVCGVETVAYQEALRQVCEVRAKERLLEFIAFVPLTTGKKSKASRIKVQTSMIGVGDYLLPVSALPVLVMFMNYNPDSTTVHDDEIDCISYMPFMIREYLDEMYAGRLAAPANLNRDSADIVRYS